MINICVVASKLSYWANIEFLYLNTPTPNVPLALRTLELKLVQFWGKVLEWEVELISLQSSFLGMTLISITYVDISLPSIRTSCC